MKKLNFYFCDVEAGCLYELNVSKQKGLLEISTEWYCLDADDDKLVEVLSYFKYHGKIVGYSKDKNLFVGFSS